MKQQRLAINGFEAYRKTTRKAEFLVCMNKFVPWSEFCCIVEPYYPKIDDKCRLVGLKRMLRRYFVTNYAACEDVLYNIEAFRHFCQFDLVRKRIPDTTYSAIGTCWSGTTSA